MAPTRTNEFLDYLQSQLKADFLPTNLSVGELLTILFSTLAGILIIAVTICYCACCRNKEKRDGQAEGDNVSKKSSEGASVIDPRHSGKYEQKRQEGKNLIDGDKEAKGGQITPKGIDQPVKSVQDSNQPIDGAKSVQAEIEVRPPSNLPTYASSGDPAYGSFAGIEDEFLKQRSR